MDEFDVELMNIELLENIGPERAGEIIRLDKLNGLSDSQFSSRYRLSKEVVVKLVTELEDVLEYPTNRNNPLTPIEQMLVGLRFFASGSFQIVMGDTENVSKATVCRYIKKIASAVADLRPRYISMPREEELEMTKKEFYTLYNFPGVIGSIDCTHIPITSPGGPNSEMFRNRKGFFSMNVQTVADCNLLIRDIVARWPGSVHDSTIFDNSNLRRLFEDNSFQNSLLLGDSGYGLKPYLMTPFLNATTEAEERFNESHIAARNTVERSYGVWKRRFPAMSLGLRTSLPTSLLIIVATAVLHNIAIQTKDIVPPDDEVLHNYLTQRRLRDPQYLIFDEVPVPNIAVNRIVPGTDVRNMIVQNHFV